MRWPRALSVVLAIALMDAMLAPPMVGVAQAEKKKPPPPKDPPKKESGCVPSRHARTADKAFCSWDQYVRSRKVNPKGRETEKARQSDRESGR
jgi:hypothetical protein